MNPSLKRAMEAIASRGKALADLLAVSDPVRKERATEAASRIVKMKENRNGITAVVTASKKEMTIRPPYQISITFEGDTVNGHHCSCPDHGTSGACKHVMAVANLWLEKVGRPTYKALRDAGRIAA